MIRVLGSTIDGFWEEVVCHEHNFLYILYLFNSQLVICISFY